MKDEALLRILLVEDVPSDAELAERELRNGGIQFASLRVDTKQEFLKALEEFQPNLILSDYAMPEFDGLQALRLSLERDAKLPFIILTGSMNEETAVACMKAGAMDYVIKGHLARLPFAVREALEKKKFILKKEAAEAALRESEERYRDLVENSQDLICTHDLEGNLLSVNESPAKVLGYSREFLLQVKMRELFSSEQLEKFKAYLKEIKEKGRASGILRIQNASGETRYWEYNSTLRTEDLAVPVVRGIAHDITERRKAELALRESEKKYRLVVDHMADNISVMDMNLRFTYISPSIMKLRGYTSEEALAQTLEQVVTPESLQVINKVFEEEMELEAGGRADPGRSRILELEEYRKDGSTVWIENRLSFMRDEANNPLSIISLSRDITERKQAEEKMQESEERYKALFNGSLDLVYITDFEGNFIDANDGALNRLGYTREEIHSLNFASFLSEDQMPLALKTLQEIREPGTQISLMEFKLRHKNGSEVYVETQGSSIMSNGTPVAFQAIARDITERKKAEEKLNRTLENLRKAMGGIIQVIAATVETRDPYTAGHQRRTADLAWAIAKEMGLTEEQQDGLLMAGIIHDLGKVSIPAEILSKPTTLTEIEYKLIKVHSQVGYDILKDIDFPWPIAEIVLKHHERMNGSGYPQGLEGNEICLEAKILMVADVVEAMASYRPYRPALGVEAALEEIEKNKGILYDSRVVEVCLELFKEKGFQFE